MDTTEWLNNIKCVILYMCVLCICMYLCTTQCTDFFHELDRNSYCTIIWYMGYTGLLYLITQPCPTLCNHMDYSPPDSSVHGDSPGKNTGVGCHDLLHEIFLTQDLYSPLILHNKLVHCLLIDNISFIIWLCASE